MSETTYTKHQKLAKIIKHYTGRDGVNDTSIPSLSLIRESTITEPISRVDVPSFCLIIQGEKEVWLGEERFLFGLGKYLVASVDLPVTGQVISASTDFPYLALKLEFSPSEILEALDDTDIQTEQKKSTKRAMFTSEVEPSLLDAVVRLASLLDNPKHIPKLAPLYKKEILYWILQGPFKDALEQMALQGSNAFRIKNVIEHIINNYERSFRIEELAELANMGVASLHRHFKEVTAMSPIQFQKQLRLQEARRLLLIDSSDVADVAFRVGYESQSQFSREYSRMFGFPPRVDIKRMKENLSLNEQSV
ncbi:AraC family transcriptional regulator [Bacillus sp. 1NLA3E]|uniref:AraC family transcriptional regulator n=1 Tax=Bacillus sp. 1NLA3E TaxID=666686 RepID=UPI000247F14B|nr:AraC family transcriptional regulator [Bacillus sp. 1NLA3E]AGK54527.1 transcriptional Regulator N/C terminus, AraC family protein [Bacillus sp. 1NLA3E]